MLDSEKYALAARLHVHLRRKLGRITDVEWMVKNAEYANEILRLARQQQDSEITGLVDRYEAGLLPQSPQTPRFAAPPSAATKAVAAPADTAGRYVDSLR
ncbi:MAG: hypothetical protein H6R19_3092 [Proteobacteria bacterium]|nr:hypothetical protein [Pseudomonadota bacterium]